jgi:hypothetical protein
MAEIGGIAEVSNQFVKNRLPSEQYQSTVGVYGGKIESTPDGKMVYSINQGFFNKIDVAGDKFLRRFDDHVAKEPWKMLTTHPKEFLNVVFKSEPMRHRGTKEEIGANIQRLGLSEYYSLSERGIEIKKPEVFTQGIAIKDIFRADQINSPVLKDIDRFQALAEETKYLKSVHEKYGAAGDFIDDVMFQKKDGARVSEPVLNIPDVVLTPSQRHMARLELENASQMKKAKAKELGISVENVQLDESEQNAVEQKVKERISKDQKATDVAELLTWTAFEEFRRSNDPLSVGKAMTTIIENYNDPVILSITRSFIRRGRPTLAGEEMDKGITALHNKVHLGANKEKSAEVRSIIKEKLSDYFNKKDK